MNMQEVFQRNLKYISNTEVDADAIKKQFVKSETRFYLTVGTVDLPTGRIVVGDPFAYLYRRGYCPQLEYTVKPGAYEVDVALCRSNLVGIRMCTVRLSLKSTEAVSYELAMPTEDTAVAKAADGVMAGFPVDAGMMALCDAEVKEEYTEFIRKWYKKNRDKNHYDDYFAAIFKESEERLPQFQREGGDFAEWAIPDSGNRIVMVASGFGDGFYQVFWGRDAEGDICELIAPLVNPDLIDEAEEEYNRVWSEPDSGCIVTKRISEDNCKVGYMYREKPLEGVPDSGWRFFEGTENEEYLNDSNNSAIMDIHDIAEMNPEIIPLLRAEYGTAYFRERDGKFVKEKR